MQMINNVQSGTKRKTSDYLQPANMAPQTLKQAAIYQSPAANNYAQVLDGLREQAAKRNPVLGPSREKNVTETPGRWPGIRITRFDHSPYNNELYKKVVTSDNPQQTLKDQYAAGDWYIGDAYMVANRIGLPVDELKRKPQPNWGNVLNVATNVLNGFGVPVSQPAGNLLSALLGR